MDEEKVIVYMCDDPNIFVPTRVGYKYLYRNKQGHIIQETPTYNLHDIADEELRIWFENQKEAQG